MKRRKKQQSGALGKKKEKINKIQVSLWVTVGYMWMCCQKKMSASISRQLLKNWRGCRTHYDYYITIRQKAVGDPHDFVVILAIRAPDFRAWLFKYLTIYKTCNTAN